MTAPRPFQPERDEAVFEAAFRAHAAELCEFAYRYIRSRDTAAELVQDVFLRLWSRRDSLADISDLRVYLFAATRNAALDALRHHRIEECWQERAHAEPAPALVGRLPHTDEPARLRELERAIESAVAALPERARQAFILRWQHHLSYAEIAAVMRISVKSVEIHRSRALKALRKTLAAWL